GYGAGAGRVQGHADIAPGLGDHLALEYPVANRYQRSRRSTDMLGQGQDQLRRDASAGYRATQGLLFVLGGVNAAVEVVHPSHAARSAGSLSVAMMSRLRLAGSGRRQCQPWRPSATG